MTKKEIDGEGLPEITDLKEALMAQRDICTDFIRRMVRARNKCGQASYFLDKVQNIANFRDILNNLSSEEVGDFYRIYMDHTYLLISIANFQMLSSSEIEKFGKFIELEIDEIEKWKELHEKFMEKLEENSVEE